MTLNKHQKDLKKRLFLVDNKAQICMQIRLRDGSKLSLKEGKSVLPLKLSKTSTLMDQKPDLQSLNMTSKELQAMVEGLGYEVVCKGARTMHFLSLIVEI